MAKEKVKLKHPGGTVVEVDATRAKELEKRGYTKVSGSKSKE